MDHPPWRLTGLYEKAPCAKVYDKLGAFALAAQSKSNFLL